MCRLLQKLSLLIAAIIIFITVDSQSATTITSSSTQVGAVSNYTITLTNQTQVQRVYFTFAAWTDTSADPFSSNSLLLFAGLTINPVYFPQQLICSLGTTVTATTFQFTLTNMRNPSSTKPYPITIAIYPTSGSTSTSYSASLALTQITNSSFSLSSYMQTVGATSSNIEMYLSPQYALQLSNTYLKITYDSSLISISFGASTKYSIVSSSAGSIILGSFSLASTLLPLTNVSITNPQAAITYTIQCLFYLANSSNYSIEAFYSTNTVTPAAFSALTTSSSLPYGILSSLAISSSCPYSQINHSASDPAYTIISYNSSQISPQSSSNCVNTSSSTCKHTLSGSYSLTNLLPVIVNANSISLTFTSYTYFQGNYYSLCQSSLSVAYSQQIISALANTTMCTSSIVSYSNSIQLYVTANSVSAGDLVYIFSLQGKITDSSWASLVINGTTWYSYTLLASNLATINSTSSKATVNLTYFNQNYTVSNSNLTKIVLYRSTLAYATTSVATALCPITTPLAITTSSISPSSLASYQPNTLSLDITMQLYDYKAGDYLIANFKSNNSGNQYIFASSYIGFNYSVSIKGIIVSTTLINQTAIKLVFTASTLPSQSQPVLTISFSNLINPPYLSSIWIEAYTYEQITAGLKESLTSSAITITASSLASSSQQLNLLANNSLTLTLTNSYRNLLTKNTLALSSSVTITLPSAISCSSVSNNSISLTWYAGVTTTGTLYSGNTTQLAFNFGSCYINYFTGTITYSVTEKYQGLSSTTTTVSITNICGDGCYLCSATTCTACFTSNYSTLINLYNGKCYSTCPAGSYQSATALCSSCHSSCSTCSGSNYTNCTACASNYQNTTQGYCLSICGQGKYLSGGNCLSCHPNCNACLSSSVCYVCKTNATLLGSVCSFTSCNSPCSTCEGTQSTCTSCLSSYYFYKSSCFTQCPYSTYPLTVNSQQICAQISQANTYVPITIAGLIGMLAIFALRAYSSKKIGNESTRSKIYRGDDNSGVNYKINVWRVGSVLYTYLQIIAGVVLVAKNGAYGLSVASSTIIIIGIIFHLLSNISFVVGYCCIVQKNKVRNSSEQPENDQKSCLVRHKIVLIISAILTFRSYKLLYSNLFVDRSTQNKQVERVSYPNEDSQNPMSKIIIRESNLPSQLPANSQKINKSMPPKPSLSNSNKKPQDLPQPNFKAENSPSKKAIRVNVLADEVIQQPLQKTSSEILIDPESINLKKLNHPFLTYLTLTNLVTATLIILIGCCLQIISSTFSNMLFWGIDALIVTIISLCLAAWDLWNFTNLNREQQNSEMSSRQQEVNYTHQNLKQAAEIEVQVDISKPKQSPKKVSSIRAKLSNRSADKSASIQNQKQDFGQPQNPPLLKVFQDIDETDKTVLKQTKTKKFSTKNLRYSKKMRPKHNISVANAQRHLHGQLCDDLYINFPSYRLEKDANTTVNYKSHRSHKSVSPNRSLQQQELQLDGAFQEQPPNFPDISDIQELKVERVDLSGSDPVAEPGQGTEALQEQRVQ